jgi:hypothetical protein
MTRAEADEQRRKDRERQRRYRILKHETREADERLNTEDNQRALKAAIERLENFKAVFLGEIAPGEDATNRESALISALRFAKAFGYLDSAVRIGETSVLDLECRNYYHAVKLGVVCIGEDGTLPPWHSTPEENPKRFDDVWIVLPDADQPILGSEFDAALAKV